MQTVGVGPVLPHLGDPGGEAAAVLLAHRDGKAVLGGAPVGPVAIDNLPFVLDLHQRPALGIAGAPQNPGLPPHLHRPVLELGYGRKLQGELPVGPVRHDHQRQGRAHLLAELVAGDALQPVEARLELQPERFRVRLGC